MRMIEFLDRAGIILTREESKRLEGHKEDDRPLSDWLCLFESLGISAPASL